MSHRTSFILALVIVGLIAIDLYFYGTEHVIFLGKFLQQLLYIKQTNT